MLTLRYPDGSTVTYNDATYLQTESTNWRLYTKAPAEGGTWIATIQPSAGVIVEAKRPCRTDRGLTPESALSYLLEHVREISPYNWRLRDLKAALVHYDARSKQWKDERHGD